VNFYTYTLIGITALLLKPSLVYADSYQFPNSSCYQLTGSSWGYSNSCDKKSTTYSLASSPSLFCAYKLKTGENATNAAKKMRYYRSLSDSILLNYTSGNQMLISSKYPSVILFSKKDLLIKNQSNCVPIKKLSNLKRAYYLLHKPNSFYVLKSALKNTIKISNESSVKNNSPLVKVKTSAIKKDSFKFPNSITIKPRLFYEKIEGKQITNSSEASISGKLSPGLNLKYTRGEHNNWRYGASLDLDFHIFDERAGEFLLSNNTVQTLAVNVFSVFELQNNISTMFMFSLGEDLFYARTAASSLGLEKELVPRLTFSTDFNLYRKNMIGINLHPHVFYDFVAGPLSSGFGYKTPLMIEFIRNDQIWSLGIEYLYLKKELSDLNLERTALSFYIKTKVFF